MLSGAEGVPRVLYIGGWGRTGSTLMARMLGQVPGFLNAGEVRDIWLKGCMQNRLCGCGARFLSCPFWASVGEEAFGSWERSDPGEMVRLRGALDRPWLLPLILAGVRPRSLDQKLSVYVDALERLYRAIRDVSGATVVVDSSKFPSYALLLTLVHGSDVRLVHLVRDSRGVVFSWGKTVPMPDSPDRPMLMPRYSPISASARYLVYNSQAELLRFARMPYLRLRYEDLVTEPSGSLGQVLRHAGLDPESVPLTFLEGPGVRLGVDHTVMGNPLRMTTGHVGLEPDQGWARGMPAGQRLAVSALTLPLLLWYRYPLGRLGKQR